MSSAAAVALNAVSVNSSNGSAAARKSGAALVMVEATAGEAVPAGADVVSDLDALLPQDVAPTSSNRGIATAFSVRWRVIAILGENS